MVDRAVKRALSYLPPASILTFQSLLSGTLEPAGLVLGPIAGESESHRRLVSSGAEGLTSLSPCTHNLLGQHHLAYHLSLPVLTI
jgi:hypothetical protein